MNLRNYQIAVCITVLSLISTNSSATSDPKKLDSAKHISIKTNTLEQRYLTVELHSEILKENRKILIHLPEDYATSEKLYPVIYLLDGNRHLPHAILAEDILQSQSLIPEAIIVAITNNSGTRRRDLSSGKNKFLKFMQYEVIKFVSEQYRTSGHRTLFGHSMAGAFTMEVFATAPKIFENYLAASPVIQMNKSELITKYRALKLSDINDKKFLYLTMGNKAAEGKSASDAFGQFVQLMNNKSTNDLSWHHERLPRQVHMTTPYTTLYAGLTYAFNDYQTPTYLGLKDFEEKGQLQGLKDYYIKRSRKYSTSPEVPESAFRSLGFALFDDGHESKGVEILKNNAKNHPSSLRALNALAQVYEGVEQPNNALSTYKKAVQLAREMSSGNLEHFERQVKRLSRH
jgi:predicted alpha/beta superfamily hydrolase